MSDDYTPIDCALYSQYELHIMHRERLKLEWRDNNGLDHIAVVQPIDLRVIDGAEYLILQADEQQPDKIRLDAIRYFQAQK